MSLLKCKYRIKQAVILTRKLKINYLIGPTPCPMSSEDDQLGSEVLLCCRCYVLYHYTCKAGGLVEIKSQMQSLLADLALISSSVIQYPRRSQNSKHQCRGGFGVWSLVASKWSCRWIFSFFIGIWDQFQVLGVNLKAIQRPAVFEVGRFR